MRRIDVNFRRPTWPPRWTWTLVGLLWIAAAGLAVLAWSEQRGVEHLRKEVAAMQSRPPEPVPAVAPLRPAYEESARRMLTERQAAWPAALKALEQVQVPGVQIVGFDITAAEQRVRVELRFSDLKQLLVYVRELNAGEPVPRWAIEQTGQPDASGAAKGFIAGKLNP